MTSRSITLTVNAQRIESEVEPRMHLGDFLRQRLGMTGTHLGWEHGVCGACTVLVNGDAVRSCLMLAVQADGMDVVTVEGLALADGSLAPIQQAFQKHHALQCGFCTPGFLTTLTQLLRDRPDIEEEELRQELSGNLCRCTGYTGIVKAALEVARELRAGMAAQ